MYNPLSPRLYYRRLFNPYSGPVSPLQMVVCVMVALLGGLIAVVIYLTVKLISVILRAIVRRRRPLVIRR